VQDLDTIIIGAALGVYSPGSAYILLHHVMGDVDGNIGAWGLARGGMGAISNAIAGAVREHGDEKDRSNKWTTLTFAWILGGNILQHINIQH
jgi:hypothetical protein